MQCPVCGNNIVYDYNESLLMHCEKYYYTINKTGKKKKEKKPMILK